MHLFLSALLHLIILRRRAVHPPAAAGATRTRAYSRVTTVVATLSLQHPGRALIVHPPISLPYFSPLPLRLPSRNTVISHYLPQLDTRERGTRPSYVY